MFLKLSGLGGTVIRAVFVSAMDQMSCREPRVASPTFNFSGGAGCWAPAGKVLDSAQAISSGNKNMPAKEEKRGGLGRVGRELELGPNAYIAKVGSERVRALARKALSGAKRVWERENREPFCERARKRIRRTNGGFLAASYLKFATL